MRPASDAGGEQPSECGSVLFVDDEPAILKGVERTFARSGIKLSTATSGAQALELFAQQRFDVVVSDQRMPGMSGSELLARVRASYPQTLTVMLSGQADVKDVVAAINEGNVFKFLLKPCPTAVLRATVSEALERVFAVRKGWPDDGDPTRRERFELLERALDGCKSVFQPIFAADGTTVRAFEALTRVDIEGVEGPLGLIALAEELDRSRDTDQRMLANSAAQMRDVPNGCDMFVNVDAATLLGDAGAQALECFAGSEERVVVEITERRDLAELEGLEPALATLRRRGFRICIDDFGAGFAGLNTLARVRPEVIKLDRALVDGVASDTVKASLVGSMVAVARELGVVVVAEGIESPADFEFVRSLGVDLVQGYLFGRPASGFGSHGERRAEAA